MITSSTLLNSIPSDVFPAHPFHSHFLAMNNHKNLSLISTKATYQSISTTSLSETQSYITPSTASPSSLATVTSFIPSARLQKDVCFGLTGNGVISNAKLAKEAYSFFSYIIAKKTLWGRAKDIHLAII